MVSRTRTLTAIAAVLLLMGVGSAASATSARSATHPRTPTAATAATAALPASVDYVALGDSYSAGPLIPAQRPDPLGCLRSTNNYPAYLAGYLDVSTYRDVTCSGARVKDFFHPQDTIIQGPSPAPQVHALSGTTDLVTVGIGGNDFGLFGSLIDTCEKVRSRDPKGAPCRKHFTEHGVDTKLRDARRIEGHVRHALRAIHREAPHARVLIVGYPRLLPESGTCHAVPFARGDYAWGRHVERTLNASIRRAAAKTGSAYVNLYPSTQGHDACAGKRAWINGSKIDYTKAANFHPFKIGERHFAHAVYRRITGRSAPSDPGSNAFPPPGSSLPSFP